MLRVLNRQNGVKSAKNMQNLLRLLIDLNSDCLVNILSCLPNDDMDSVAICSKSCREARASDTLDQTRTGTIMCTENTTLESIHGAFVRQGWAEVFTGNRTRLKVVGLGRMPMIRRDVEVSPNHALPNVTSLDLYEIDLSHTTNVQFACVRHIRLECHKLRRIIRNASEYNITMQHSTAKAYLTTCRPLDLLQDFARTFAPFANVQFIVLHRPYINTSDVAHFTFDGSTRAHAKVISGHLLYLSSLFGGQHHHAGMDNASWTLLCVDQLRQHQTHIMKRMTEEPIMSSRPINDKNQANATRRDSCATLSIFTLATFRLSHLFSGMER